MKVLMPVLHYYPVIGGLEAWTKNIAEGLAKTDDVFVVTGKTLHRQNKDVANGVNIWRTSLYTLSDFSHSSFFYIVTSIPFIFLKSLALIKKEKIDILHCQGFVSGFLGFFLSKLNNIPYIVTVQRIEENKGYLRKLVYANANHCIAASKSIESYFESMGVKKIKVIPNGVNLRKFANIHRAEARKELRLEDEFVVISVARLEKVKGISYLVRAADIISTRFHFEMPNFKILIIGDGSDRKYIEQLIEAFNLGGRVKLIGQVKNREVPNYLAAGDCFVLPSEREGFGIVILEAMASHLPVIATNVGGVPDIVKHEQTGLLVDSKNPEQIARAILRLYKDKDLSTALRLNAYSALGKYDWDSISQEVKLIYQNLVK